MASYFLGKVQELYTLERQCKEAGYSNEERKAIPQRKAVPVSDDLEKWLKESLAQVLQQSAIVKAIAYTLGLWHRPKRFVDDGNLEIDNNLIEKSIMPVALRRKNYLFIGSHDGAKRAVMVYSFPESCKINNVNPSVWLTDVLNRIHNHKAKKLVDHLPKTGNQFKSSVLYRWLTTLQLNYLVTYMPRI